MKIEVCINRLEDVKTLRNKAVDRIELCIELYCGGLTPSLAMVEQALKISTIPIHVLVRPRSGNFVYSKTTIDSMLKTCKQLEQLEVQGIVTGALNPSRKLDPEVLKLFRNTVQNSALYFHRAFDEIINPERALLELQNFGFDGVLTSGQQKTAMEGIEQLVSWQQLISSKFTILPGSGINANNCLNFKSKGFGWIHLSAKKLIHSHTNASFEFPQYGLDMSELNTVISKIKPS